MTIKPPPSIRLLAAFACLVGMPLFAQNDKPTPSSAGTRLPNTQAIELEAQKQLKNSQSAIQRATRQATIQAPSLPAIEPSQAVPVPDPANLARAINRQAQEASAPALFVLVSFSLPKASIEQLAHQAARAGAVLVLRGVVENSLQKTSERSMEMIKANPQLQLQIDPTLFQRFSVKAVPAFILARSTDDIKSCTQFCDSTDNFVSASGDVSLEYVLDKFTQSAPADFASISQTYLKRIRSQR